MLTEEQKQQVLKSKNFIGLLNKQPMATSTSMSFRERANQLKARNAELPTGEETGQEDTGIFGRLKETGGDIFETIQGAGEVVGERARNIGETFKKTASGEYNPLTTGAKTVGEVAGLFNDIAGNVYSGLAKVLVSQDTEDSVKEKIASFAEDSGAVEALRKGGEVWKSFEQQNPQTAEVLKGLGNIGLAGLDVFSFGGASKGVKAGKEAIEETASSLGRGIKETGESAISGVKQATPGISEKIGEVATYATGQATGLKPSTIKKIISEPEKYTKEILESVDSQSVADNVFGKIKERVKALSDTGAGYKDIRNSGEVVTIDPEFLSKKLKEAFDIDIVDGKVKATTKSKTRSSSDLKAIQDVYNNWGNKSQLDASEFLNLRSDLAELSYTPIGTSKTGAVKDIGNELRTSLNKEYRKQLTGLEELDNTFTKEKKLLSGVQKDYFDKRGALKDNAVNKLSNILNKEPVVERLEKLIPDIREQLNVLEVVKDIEYASGRAVGTYARSIIGAGGAVSGNVPAVVGAIVSTPKLAVPLLRKYGQFKKINGSLIEATIKTMTSGGKLVGRQLQLVKNFLKQTGDKIKKWIDEIKNNESGFARIPGGKMSNKDTAIVDTFLDKMKAGEDIPNSMQLAVAEVAEDLGLPEFKTLDELAGALDDKMREIEGGAREVIE